MNKIISGIELKIILLTIFIIGFIADAFFITSERFYTDWISDVRLFLLLLLWIAISKLSRFTSIATFKFALIILIFLSLSFVFERDNPSTERLASWLYFFLTTGVVQQMLEVRKRNDV